MATKSRAYAVPQLVLAFVMVVTVLQAIVPQVEAATAPAGTMTISTAPDFLSPATSPPLTTPPTLYAGTVCTQSYCQRTVRVSNGFTMDRIEFVYWLRMADSNPPAVACGAAPPVPKDDPCELNLVWDPDHSYATRPGWTATADNRATGASSTPPAHILRFDALSQPDSKLNSSANTGSGLANAIDFVIAFKISGGPSFGDEFHVQLKGFPSGGPQEFETTCAATRAPYYTCAFSNPSTAGGPDPAIRGTSADATVTPSLRIIYDDDAPIINTPDFAGGVYTLVTRDTDNNGHLDRLVATFTERLDPDSFDWRAFGFATRGRTFSYGAAPGNACPVATNGYTITNAAFTNALGATATQVTFLVKEMPYYDTGDTPAMTYSPCGKALTDLAGNRMRSISGTAITAIDGAKPVLVGALAIVGGDTAQLTWSEPVAEPPSNTASCNPGVSTPCCPAGDAPPCTLRVSDFGYVDDGSLCSPPAACPNAIQGMAQFATVDHTVGTTSGNTAKLTTAANPGNSGATYKWGTADLEPLTGDQFTAAPGSFTPCVTGLETSPCDSKIVDINTGLHMWHPLSPPAASTGARHVTYPLIQSATVDVSHNQLTVTFNGPVRAPPVAGSTSTKPQPFAPGDLDIVATTGTGVGPQGISSARYLVADSDTAIFNLDFPARATDVDNTPAYVRVHAKKILGSGLPLKFLDGSEAVQAYVPFDNPDVRYENSALGKGDTVAITPDVGMVDKTPPTIIDAKTVDGNHDGFLDGIEFTFSEPIDDTQFCAQQNTLPYYCPDSTFPIGGSPATGFMTFHRWSSNDPKERECLGSFKWDTGVVTNDEHGIVSAVNVTKDSSGAYITRIRNCVEFYNSKMTGTRLPTDYLPHMTTLSPGLFQDLASPANLMPKYCQYERTTATYPDICVTSEKTFETLRIRDGAPPAVWLARTVDTPLFDRDGARMTKDTDLPKAHFGDGNIDGYRILFSEPVNDGTFNVANWKIGDYDKAFNQHNVTKSRSYDLNETKGYLKANDAEYTLAFTPAPRAILAEGKLQSIAGDHVGILKEDGSVASFDIQRSCQAELSPDHTCLYIATPGGANDCIVGGPCAVVANTGGDTAERPELTYQRTPSGAGLADLLGNVMVDFDRFAVTEVDGARPEITAVRAVAGDSRLTITFSEPVDDGNLGSIVAGDFFYHNYNSAGVAGKADPVTHTAGDRIAYLPLDKPLIAADLGVDKINPEAGKIYETARSLPAASRQFVPNYQIAINTQVDTVPPAGITDLRVVPELTNANAITLSWTAPADNGLSGPAVAAYTWKANKTAFSSGGQFDAAVQMTGLTATYTWSCSGSKATTCAGMGDYAPVNVTQTVRITGLDPETTYHFALRAVDAAGNAGALSNDVSGTTKRDGTPPQATLTVKSLTHNADTPTPSHDARFSWNTVTAAQEPESDVVYRYALNQNPNYQVLGTDRSTPSNTADVAVPDDGTWTFSVAACSGGGCTPTARVTILVGPSKLDGTSMQAANDKLRDATTATRKQVTLDNGDKVYLNVVNWTLPEKGSLPGTVEGLEIWRLDAGIPTRIDTIPGTYEQLQVGNYTDLKVGATPESKYRVNMLFEPDQRQPEPSSAAQFVSLKNTEPGQVPPWVFVLLGIALALVIAGIVIYFVLRGRQKVAATGGVAYAWESANPDATGVDATTGLPVHEVKCPSCNNPFQAVGQLPLPVTCPNCSTTGMLE